MQDDDLRRKIESYFVTIRGATASHIVGSSDYDRGYADGMLDGRNKVIADIQALLQVGEMKPLVLHGRCKVINGMWKDREGHIVYIGFDATGTREIAQVLLDGMDLPVDIQKKDLSEL